jgi:hypothetical protein
MKTLTLQIFGLVFNLFIVFIIVSYSNLKKFVSSEINYENLNNVTPILTNGMVRNTLTLKRISILLIKSYIILNINFLSEINSNGISFLDGMIKITETTILKTSLLFIISIIILFNQSKTGAVGGVKTEKYIILLTNI